MKRRMRPSPFHRPRAPRDGKYTCAYGLKAAFPAPDWFIDLQAWSDRIPTGLPPIEHLRRACASLHPDCQWTEWRERRFLSLCDDSFADKLGGTTIRNIQWVGPAAAGKTFDAGDFGFLWWLANSLETVVILTSTSKTKMKQRVWPVIQARYLEAKAAIEACGGCLAVPHMLNSTLELQALKGDSKHSIFAQAVEPGDLAQAVERLKGVHCPRIMLVMDEAPGTPEAIFRTIPNLQKGCRELIVLCTGNGPMTHLDPFSKCCTPKGGWSSVNVEHESWETRPVPEYQLPRGHCLHFDGPKSPNVKAGRTLYPFLYTWENWQRAQADPLYQRTAEFYSQDRGFWPPEGFLRTVLSEEMLEQGGARGRIEFSGPTTPIGAIDTGFGGDQCILRFGLLGPTASKTKAVQITDTIVIPILVDALDAEGKRLPAEYQIASRVMEEARLRGVEARHFGIEATGTGRGAAAVLTQTWGEVVWVESGGKPTDLPASEEDERAARDVYDRKITELWFSVQSFVKGKQLGGLTEDDCMQFCARQYDYVSKKYVLEKKEDLKPRLGRSPDHADSAAVLVHVARLLGMETRGPRFDRMLSMWDREISLQNRLYRENSLYQPEEAPFESAG